MTDIPEANDDIDAVAAFPAEPDVSAGFPSKAPLKILLGFRNNGDVPVNVTHIAASLNVPQMVSFYVTNFTVQTPLVTVEPGKEASFEYPFVLDPALAGHDFILAATAFYEDEAETFASTFHNATISVLDPVGAFDAQTLTVMLYDPALRGAVKRAIEESSLGFNPREDGDALLVPVPEMTAETRRNVGKLAAKAAEAAKISVRNARKKGMDAIKKAQMTEDERKRAEKALQGRHDEHVKRASELAAKQEKQIAGEA